MDTTSDTSTTRPTLAVRATHHAARRHFNAGGAVLVSEHGHEPHRPVTPSTTVHTSASTTWDDLAALVAMWRNRYPNQRYYTVTPAEDDA